jgi:hypothetical protein
MAAAHGGPGFTGEKERWRRYLEAGMCTAKGEKIQMTSLRSSNQVKQKRREER